MTKKEINIIIKELHKKYSELIIERKKLLEKQKYYRNKIKVLKELEND